MNFSIIFLLVTKLSIEWSIVFLSWSCLNIFMNTCAVFVNNLATNDDENLQMFACFPMQQWCSEHLKNKKFHFFFFPPDRFLNMFVFHRKEGNKVQVLPRWGVEIQDRHSLFWPFVNFKQADLTWFVVLMVFLGGPQV